MVALALMHFYLARLLGWKEDLKKLKPINEQVFNAHTIFLTGGVFLLGLSCLIFPVALTARSQLGMVASICFAMCWLSRLICQIVLFTAPISEDTKLDALLRVAGTLLWIFYTALFSVLFAFQIGVMGN